LRGTHQIQYIAPALTDWTSDCNSHILPA